MTIRKQIEVEVDIDTDELIREIKLCGVLDLVWIFKAVIETMTDGGLVDLRKFVGDEAFGKFDSIVTSFMERVHKVAEKPKPPPNRDVTDGLVPKMKKQ